MLRSRLSITAAVTLTATVSFAPPIPAEELRSSFAMAGTTLVTVLVNGQKGDSASADSDWRAAKASLGFTREINEAPTLRYKRVNGVNHVMLEVDPQSSGRDLYINGDESLAGAISVNLSVDNIEYIDTPDISGKDREQFLTPYVYDRSLKQNTRANTENFGHLQAGILDQDANDASDIRVDITYTSDRSSENSDEESREFQMKRDLAALLFALEQARKWDTNVLADAKMKEIIESTKKIDLN